MFSHGLSCVPESLVKEQGSGLGLADSNEMLYHQPQLEGEVWILFCNTWQSFMVGDMVKLLLIYKRQEGQIGGRGANTLVTDAVNQRVR